MSINQVSSNDVLVDNNRSRSVFMRKKIDAINKLADALFNPRFIDRKTYFNASNEFIFKCFTELHAGGKYNYQYDALRSILDLVFPEWREFATKEAISKITKREDKLVYEWRNKVLKNANFKCESCGNKNNLYAHHILSWAKYPESRIDADNGECLCGECHSKQHPDLSERLFADKKHKNGSTKRK